MPDSLAVAQAALVGATQEATLEVGVILLALAVLFLAGRAFILRRA